MQTGDKILVRDSKESEWIERILLTANEQSFFCIDKQSEHDFLEGRSYLVIPWKYGKIIKPEIVYYKWEKVTDDRITNSGYVTDEYATKLDFIGCGYIKIEDSKRTKTILND